LFGYAGRVLIVDLDIGRTRAEQLNTDFAQKYVGGIGLGMRLWIDHTKQGVDLLVLITRWFWRLDLFLVQCFPQGKWTCLYCKIPATNGIGEAVSHGTFGAELKRAGYDAVVIKGKSEKPVYLWIDDDSVQLLDASNLMGKSPSETEDAIKDELGDYYVRVASIV